MKYLGSLAASLVILAVSGTAVAQEEESAELPRFKVGFRTGWGIPMGKIAGETTDVDAIDLGRLYSGQIPLWFDLGYMVTDNILVGAYGQYGIGVMSKGEGDACDENANYDKCKGSNLRFGIQGQYHIKPGAKVNPWLGLGIGYELAKVKAEAAGVEIKIKAKGMEFLNLQGGADFQLSPMIGVGPFASFSLGQYAKYKIEAPGISDDGGIENKKLHMWLLIGARVMFGF